MKEAISADEGRIKAPRERLEVAEGALDQALRGLVDAEKAAKATPIGADLSLDWRTAPGLIAATRALDEAETRARELADHLEQMNAEDVRARQALDVAEGAHLS